MQVLWGMGWVGSLVGASQPGWVHGAQREIRIKILEHLIAFSRIELRIGIGFGRARLRAA